MPIPSPGRTRTLKVMGLISLTGRRTGERLSGLAYCLFGLRISDQCDDLFVHQAFFTVGQRSEAVIERVQFFLVEGESEILAALMERVPSAVFSEHQPSDGHPHALGVDDLV